MTVQASPAEPFLIARAFDAPVDTVWAAWTRPAAFTRWFGPAGTTTRIVTFDLRPGGMLHSVMQTPVGSMGAKFVYRTVEPPTRLVWEHSFADEHGAIVRAPFSPSWPLRLLTDRDLRPAGRADPRDADLDDAGGDRRRTADVRRRQAVDDRAAGQGASTS